MSVKFICLIRLGNKTVARCLNYQYVNFELSWSTCVTILQNIVSAFPGVDSGPALLDIFCFLFKCFEFMYHNSHMKFLGNKFQVCSFFEV